MKQEFNEYLAELKLGNRLELVFKWVGIKWLVKKLNPGCKCEERREKLNNFQIKIKRK